MSNEETAELTAVGLPSGRILATASVGREPEGVTLRPDGKYVYVTSEQDGEVTALDASESARATPARSHTTKGPRLRGLIAWIASASSACARPRPTA